MFKQFEKTLIPGYHYKFISSYKRSLQSRLEDTFFLKTYFSQLLFKLEQRISFRIEGYLLVLFLCMAVKERNNNCSGHMQETHFPSSSLFLLVSVLILTLILVSFYRTIFNIYTFSG